MKFATLAPVKADKEKNVVEITNRKIDPTSEKGKTFSIDAERFEYPVVENFAEFIQICGGDDDALEIINDHIRDSAITEGKNRIRIATTGSDEDIINAGLAITKNYTFVQAAKVSAAEAREKFGALKALAGASNMSDAELAEAVRKLAGL